MNNKVYFLSTCSTCKRILNEIALPDHLILQDIKHQPISEKELDFMKKYTGSYESLFNKRAQLYKQRDLKNKHLTEADYKQLLLEHYTFLSRPVFVISDKVFVGNTKSIVAQVKQYISE